MRSSGAGAFCAHAQRLPLLQPAVRNSKSKKQLIEDYARTRHLERAGPREIQVITEELRGHFGSQDNLSPSYVANVLRRSGVSVNFDDRYVDPAMEEPYAGRLKGLLRFSNFEKAETSLQKLDTVYREYRAVSDRIGTGLVRSLVIKGRERAASMAANPRVSPEKRREKGEIAHWFKVWLDVPDLFFDWLELRKKSKDFQELFGRDGMPQ